jgi:hypothetical protein
MLGLHLYSKIHVLSLQCSFGELMLITDIDKIFEKYIALEMTINYVGSCLLEQDDEQQDLEVVEDD